jgi:predicted ester cyclase
MTQANKLLARRSFEEIWNQRNLAAIEEIYAPDYIGHIAATTDVIRGVEGFKQFVGVFQFLFSNTRFTIADQLAEGEQVASRWTARTTDQREIMGLASSREVITLTGISIQRMADGKIAESWDNWDALGILQGSRADIFELLSVGA